MNSSTQPTRLVKLQKRFLDVLAGIVKIDPRSASLFLECLCAQDDPASCIDAIANSVCGTFSVQSAMSYDLSAQFMNGLGSQTLSYLLRAQDLGGNALDNLLFHVVEPPVFWSAFVRWYEEKALSEDAQLAFARVLARLLTLPDRDTSPYRHVAARPNIQNRLATSSRHDIREMGYLIKHLLSSSSSPAGGRDSLGGPGGRHDNDFSNFRHIAIIPTGDEIMCPKPSFLCSFHDDLAKSEKALEDYIDNSFRLLREDMIFDIREEVTAAQQKNGQHRGLRIQGLTMVGIHTTTKGRWGIKLRCDRDLWQLKNIKGDERRREFLCSPRGSKILKHQSLVCLMVGEEIISFGTVNRVEGLLAGKTPVIVVEFHDSINARKTICSLSMHKGVQLIQIDVATFAFEPVLTALQKMHIAPLHREILSWNTGSPVSPASNCTPLSSIVDALRANSSIDLSSILGLPAPVHLDEPQAKSMIAGLTQRVCLIQGPPGTGKSFIGALLAKALHDKTTHTMLVVCYTNHALDQFIEDLLQYGIPDDSIVRLGSRSNPSLDHLSLHQQPRPQVIYAWGIIDALKRDAAVSEKKLEELGNRLSNVDKNLIIHLKFNHRAFFDAFQVPVETEGSMKRVGRNGKVIEKSFLFSRWKWGQGAGVLEDEPNVRAAAHIWGMNRADRMRLMEEWRNEIVVNAAQSISETGHIYNKLKGDINSKFGESTVAILRQKRVIACTTTGAAIHADVIKSARPEVLLVEEAGEILESHVLTALSKPVERMILIGDHKQLRPKVNNYQLTVERGEGYDLNRSLFERLVLKGYPHTTLSMQHRMRPEISTFVRELTYPELVDAPSTSRRSDIHGLSSNIIFVDHTYPEDDDSLVGDRLDGRAKGSKQNKYEVEMVLKIVRYLGQQGYKSENIVVLTPYLGQLYKLRDALKSDNDPVLNEMDSSDLARAGLSTYAPTEQKASKAAIKLATIDNYQGEESDIVIASLTRSNTSNIIGFMYSPERLNVLLSRARDGLILIGNSQTFLGSKKGGALWSRLFSLLEERKYIYQGFPVKCQRHPERAVLLKRASDFEDYCPDGGCTQPCGFVLECGHVCPMKCHLDRSKSLVDPHDFYQCKAIMRAACTKGLHQILWECRDERPVTCSTCVKEKERLESIARKQREAEKREQDKVEHQRHMAELETELEIKKAAAEDCMAEGAYDEEDEVYEEEEEVYREEEKVYDEEEEALTRMKEDDYDTVAEESEIWAEYHGESE